MSLESLSVITIMLVHPFDFGRSVTKSIVNSLPTLSGIGKDFKNLGFASRQTDDRPHTSQFRTKRRTDSLIIGQNHRRESIPIVVSLPG